MLFIIAQQTLPLRGNWNSEDGVPTYINFYFCDPAMTQEFLTG